MTESFINKDCKLTEIVQLSLDVYLQATEGRLVSLTWDCSKPTRSILQNKYYWGVVISMLSKEIGYHPDYMHAYMKELFLWVDEQDMPDGKTARVVHDTKNLTTIQFEDYIYKIRQWAGEFLLMDIPLPNQTQFDYTGFE